VKEVEMDWTCSMHGEVRNACIVWLKNLKGRDSFGDMRIEGRII
jgi:hypothetical protein